MGVRKLNKFLNEKKLIRTYANLEIYIESIKNMKLSKNNGYYMVAIDFWLYAHKTLHSKYYTNIISSFYYQIIKFLSLGVIPIYVIDGHSPNYKMTTDIRKDKNNRYLDKLTDIDNILTLEENNRLIRKIRKMSTIDFVNIKKLFEILNIPLIYANNEADALCVKLYKENIIIGCFTDDMDMIPLGCDNTLKFNGKQIIQYNLEYIKTELDMTQEQIIDMCILLGCDYLIHSIKIDNNEIYKLIKKYGSFINILESGEHPILNINNSDIKIIGEKYYDVCDVYTESPNKETIPDILKSYKYKYINPNKLIDFLKMFINSFININKINKINNLFN